MVILDILIGAVIDGIRDVLAEILGRRFKAFLAKRTDRERKRLSRSRRKRERSQGAN